MAVFAIGDLHLSFGTHKPMDIFGGVWENHAQKILKNWTERVCEGDTVVICGDTSWAMDFKGLEPDFDFLEALPGRKILLKGNHDYWWNTLSKLRGFIREKGFGSIEILHNNAYRADSIAVCGTRGWPFDEKDTNEADKKILLREAGRLRASLDAGLFCGGERVAFLHYPPVYEGFRCVELLDILKQYGIRRCYYGHLHDSSILRAVQGDYQGISFRLISCDAVDFTPVRVTE